MTVKGLHTLLGSDYTVQNGRSGFSEPVQFLTAKYGSISVGTASGNYTDV